MRVPKLRKNGDGRAFAAIPKSGGKRVYFGRYGTAEAAAKYRKWLAAIIAPDETEPQENAILTVAGVARLYLIYAESYYSENGETTKEFGKMRYAVRHFVKSFANEPANAIGPSMLVAIQRKMAAENYARTGVNDTIGRIKRFVKWCSLNEYIPAETYAKLQCVEGLRRGQFGVRETAPVEPADIEDVKALLPHVSPVIADMIRLQYLCGMRPGEVTIMRLQDIDDTGDVWLYTPHRHKTEYRGKSLVKAVPTQAQAILSPYFEQHPEGYLFRPKDSEEWRHSNRPAYSNRQRTTKLYPSEERSKAKQKAARARARSKRSFRPHYNTESYYNAICHGFTRAEREGVEIRHWHPNQLRHLIATDLRQILGEEEAQIWLGHADINTTKIYTAKQRRELISVARQLQDLLPVI